MIETFRRHDIENYFHINLGLTIRHVELDKNILGLLYQQYTVIRNTPHIRNFVALNEELDKKNYLYGMAVMFSHFMLDHHLSDFPVIEITPEAEAAGMRLPEIKNEQRRQADILARSILRGTLRKNFNTVWESIECEIDGQQMIEDIRAESIFFSTLVHC